MKEVVSERTKVPIMWLFVPLPFVITFIMYMFDIKSDARVVQTRVDLIEKKQDSLNKDIREDIRRLADKIDSLIRRN